MSIDSHDLFIAGAGGTLGLPLTRRLVEAGHRVTGLTRSAGKAAALEAAGARVVVADALDRAVLRAAVARARPSVVVNLLTALPAAGARRPRDLRATNRLRVEGTANLLEAAAEAGARRVVAESFLAVFGRPEPGGRLVETDELAPVPPADPLGETVDALRSLEDQHGRARRLGRLETVVLRFGFFYGPGVASTVALVRDLQAGRVRLPKAMPGLGSWIHLDDAVSATQAAIETARPEGLYHVVDDDPLPLEEAVAAACAALGTPPPGRMPAWLLRWAAPVLWSLMTARLPLDNGRIGRDFGWRPAYPTLREGFADLARYAREAA